MTPIYENYRSEQKIMKFLCLILNFQKIMKSLFGLKLSKNYEISLFGLKLLATTVFQR